MEPADQRRDDNVGACQTSATRVAAMEPASERRDDVPAEDAVARAARRNGARR
jgi:hypothetical protein